MSERVDVHAHHLPDVYRQALVEAGQTRPDGIRELPAWSEAEALATMDRLGVHRAVLSISSPGVYFGDAGEAAQLSRAVNEEAVALRERHPGRFDFFASTPVPDVDAAESELVTALDDMGALGLVLETHSEGIYLGDQRLEPLYAILHQRRATLFVHPTTPFEAQHLTLGRPAPLVEFMFETSRSVTDLVLAGVLDRHPDMRVIVPHAGAALAFTADRVDLAMSLVGPGGTAAPSLRGALDKLDYDLAGVPVPHQLAALLTVSTPERIHYGSDYPFTPLAAAEVLLRALETTDLLDDAAREQILGPSRSTSR